MGELHLGLEVADRAQAADDRAGAAGAAQVDGQAVERLDLDPIRRCAGLGERLADDADPGLDVEQRRLPRVGKDRHDERVEHVRGTLDDVEVAVGDRVERARDRPRWCSSILRASVEGQRRLAEAALALGC